MFAESCNQTFMCWNRLKQLASKYPPRYQFHEEIHSPSRQDIAFTASVGLNTPSVQVLSRSLADVGEYLLLHAYAILTPWLYLAIGFDTFPFVSVSGTQSLDEQIIFAIVRTQHTRLRCVHTFQLIFHSILLTKKFTRVQRRRRRWSRRRFWLTFMTINGVSNARCDDAVCAWELHRLSLPRMTVILITLESVLSSVRHRSACRRERTMRLWSHSLAI